MTRRLLLTAAAVAWALVGGCGRKAKEVTSLQRKEAATLVSEAQFAVSIREYARAEAAYEKAASLCPDTGEFWLALGQVRVRLGKRGDARKNYQAALAAYEDEAAARKDDPQPAVQQVTVLALLGRVDDARSLLEKLPARFPDDANVRAFVADKPLDRMLEDPAFKELAL